MGTPSHGVGSEWERCLVKPKLNLPLTPMLGFYMEGRGVSPHITGISEEEARYVWFRSYRSEEDLAKTISEFLAEFS